MTETPDRVITLQSRADRQLSELLDLFQELRFNTDNPPWPVLKLLSGRIKHLIDLVDFYENGGQNAN